VLGDHARRGDRSSACMPVPGLDREWRGDLWLRRRDPRRALDCWSRPPPRPHPRETPAGRAMPRGGGPRTSGELPLVGIQARSMSRRRNHSVARRGDGSVVSWGQISGAPPLPPGLEYVEVTAGHYRRFAHRSDGSIVAWGCNSFLQTTVPTRPPGSSFVGRIPGTFSLARYAGPCLPPAACYSAKTNALAAGATIWLPDCSRGPARALARKPPRRVECGDLSPGSEPGCGGAPDESGAPPPWSRSYLPNRTLRARLWCQEAGTSMARMTSVRANR